MKDFGDFKVTPPTLDGKKNFKGQKISSQELDKKGIIVIDFERDVVPKREREDYNRRLQSASAQGIDPALVEKPKTKYIISLFYNNELRKLWTGCGPETAKYGKSSNNMTRWRMAFRSLSVSR